jgi:hypothetical protein
VHQLALTRPQQSFDVQRYLVRAGIFQYNGTLCQCTPFGCTVCLRAKVGVQHLDKLLQDLVPSPEEQGEGSYLVTG